MQANHRTRSVMRLTATFLALLVAVWGTALADRPETARSKSEVLVIGNFRDGKDGRNGFEGALQIDKKGGRAGAPCGILANKNQRWVEIGKKFNALENDFRDFSMWVNSTDVKTIALRFVNALDQNYQQRLPFDSDGQWHQLTISKFNQGESWGGPQDGRWHPPAKAVAIVVESRGSVKIDDLTARLNPVRLSSLYSLHSPSFGNVFSAGEKPTFQIDTQAEEIQYTVNDYLGRSVAEGSLKVENGSARLSPEIQAIGYFHTHLTLRAKHAPPLEKDFDFGILRSFHGMDMSRSPFGVMTHFAQDWNTDLIPLLSKYGVAAVRDEVYWGHVEGKNKGSFDFARQDLYMGKLKQAGITPLVVLSFANKFYDGGMTPCTQEGYDGYARYAEEILKHYGSQIRWLEVWNEYNGSFCQGKATEDRPRYYTALAKRRTQGSNRPGQMSRCSAAPRCSSLCHISRAYSSSGDWTRWTPWSFTPIATGPKASTARSPSFTT